MFILGIFLKNWANIYKNNNYYRQSRADIIVKIYKLFCIIC